MDSFDLELVLIDYPVDRISSLSNALPQDFSVESRIDKGWGAVISLVDDGNQAVIDEALGSFLQSLSGILDEIKSHKAILRVAIYTDAVGYTLRLKSFDILSKFGVQLEASVYPTE